MMNTIVQWATILSPIIAVVIAWWASWRSAKDTAKKIAAIEENTAKQIESVKELSRLTIEASVKQVEMEIEKCLFYANQAKDEWEGVQNVPGPQNAWDVNWKERGIREFKEKKPEWDYKHYCEFIKDLKSFKQRLEDSMKSLSE